MVIDSIDSWERNLPDKPCPFGKDEFRRRVLLVGLDRANGTISRWLSVRREEWARMSPAERAAAERRVG